MWKIYFDLYIDKAELATVEAQAQKLLKLSESVNDWVGGPYGSLLKFYDKNSLEQVRQIWQKYAYFLSSREKKLKQGLKLTKRLRMTLPGKPGQQEPLTLTTSRSAAPLSFPAGKDEQGLRAWQYYWKNGQLTKHLSTIPNPLFVDTTYKHTVLHYSTDPILGFHVATAYAELKDDSPLRPCGGDSDAFSIVTAAKTQFDNWVLAFQEIAREEHIVIRFIVSDALSLSNALQTTRASDTNLYHRQLDATPIKFDLTTSQPTKFDVVDTSNLADTLHTLNVLVATAPLLKASASSTLWTEAYVKRGHTADEKLDGLLCGHAPTMSLLLGVFLAEYSTNATPVSCVDEAMIGSVVSFQLSHHRFAWKPSLAHGITLHVHPDTLAQTIFEIYKNMFKQESWEMLRHGLSIDEDAFDQEFLENSCPLFDRGSFAAFRRRVKASVSTDWESLWKQFLKMVRRSGSKTFLWNNHWEGLCLQLHLNGLYTDGTIKGPIQSIPDLGGHFEWEHVPEAVCVTLVVPRALFDDAMYRRKKAKKNPPALEGIVGVGKSVNNFINSFGNVHIAFGHVQTSHKPEDDNYSVTINQDPSDTAPVVASYYVASKALEDDSKDLIVGLSFCYTLVNYNVINIEEVPAIFYYAKLSDSNVFVTKYEPNMSGYPSTRCDEGTATGAAIRPLNDNEPFTAKITVNLEDSKLVSMCAHVDFSSSRRAKALRLAGAVLKPLQISPMTINLKLETANESLVHSISFPVPVVLNYINSRNTRTSSHADVVVSLASPLDSDTLSAYLYPITLASGSLPVVLNGYSVSLDTLPRLNVDKSKAKANKWVETLISHQFSVRERILREGGKHKSIRIGFKQSVSEMFIAASGLREDQMGILVLVSQPSNEQIVIFVQDILLHGAEASIVMDAAVLPLTEQLLNSGKLKTFLKKLSKQQVCAIDVNDELLALWKRVLPAFAERCRTWLHGPNCEYKEPGATVPLTTTHGEQFMCSCGNGQFDPSGFTNVPGWDKIASKHAVRVAISPTFPVPFVEEVVDTSCRSCGATKPKDGVSSLICKRCKDTIYCSWECYRDDEKRHLEKDCLPGDKA